jgi:hypothetical protein
MKGARARGCRRLRGPWSWCADRRVGGAVAEGLLPGGEGIYGTVECERGRRRSRLSYYVPAHMRLSISFRVVVTPYTDRRRVRRGWRPYLVQERRSEAGGGRSSWTHEWLVVDTGSKPGRTGPLFPSHLRFDTTRGYGNPIRSH